jgi:hypothetical protein
MVFKIIHPIAGSHNVDGITLVMKMFDNRMTSRGIAHSQSVDDEQYSFIFAHNASSHL